MGLERTSGLHLETISHDGCYARSFEQEFRFVGVKGEEVEVPTRLDRRTPGTHTFLNLAIRAKTGFQRISLSIERIDEARVEARR